MKLLLLTTIAGLALSPIAYAQNANAPTTNTPSANAQNENASGANATGASSQKNFSVRQHVQDSLKQAGFTDIKVRPEAFLVSAKDKSGNPVMISVTPNSLEEVTIQDTTGSIQGQNGQNGGEFVTVPSSDKLSSNLVGLNVYNNDDKDIGTIKDISVDRSGVRAYILSVGGFLGMGTRYVAVNPSAVKVSYNESDKKWHATMNADADQLKAAPEFKYTGPWQASKM